MNISIWDIFKYIFKWKFFIIGAVIVSILLSYVYVNSNQTYSAAAVIQLNNECIKSGNAPDGTRYDYNEIVSPNVMTDVIEELGLSKTVDSLRTRITITPIIPDTETEIKESMEKEGEKYEYFPNTFQLGYNGRGGESASYVRDILEAVVDNYIEFYTEKYGQLVSINDIAFDAQMGNYDYIEMADMLSDNVDDIIVTLDNYYEKDSSFRSTTTGLNFSDIVKEYKYLEEFVIPEIYSDIYRGQITKDKELLIKTYTQKKEQYLIEKNTFLNAAEMAKTRMDSFATANKNVPNAYNKTTEDNNDDLEIINEVHDEINPNNTSTTYDTLINDYVDKSAEANHRQVEAERCDEIIAKFTAETDKFIDVEAIKSRVEREITSAQKKMTELAKTTNETINDYNEYSSTENVSSLTGVNYYANLTFSIYALIAVVGGAFLSVIFALAVEITRAIKRGKETAE